LAKQTHDFWRFFWTSLPAQNVVKPGTPFMHLAPVWEVEEPFRKCMHALVIRPRRGKRLLKNGLVLGFWRKTGFETVEEMEVFMGLIVPEDGFDLEEELTDLQKQQARERIGQYDWGDIEEEYKVLEMMDLM
jgi:hypothetical protein